jgi:hypothetical protein
MVPPAIQEMIYRYFGEAGGPNWSATAAIMDRDPYRAVRESLAMSWDVHDDSDANYALGTMLLLSRGANKIWVRLSYVAPFAFIHDVYGRETTETSINEFVLDSGFSVLSRALLETPLDLWGPDHRACLYEYLFEFDEGLPWAR